MIWPLRVQDILNELARRHPTWVADDTGPRFNLNRMFAEQVVYELGPKYGLKRADPGRPISSENLAIEDGVRLYAWSWENQHNGEVEQFPEWEDITGQTFVPVDPVNHLGIDRPPPPPVLDLSGIVAKLSVIETRLNTISARFEELATRLATMDAALEGLTRRSPPRYSGTVAIRYLGSAPIRLTPDEE